MANTQLDMFDDFEQAEQQSSVLPNAPPDDINQKMEILLNEFEQSGYITTYDAERMVHRGQAVVGEMRSRGHIIETTSVGEGGLVGYIYRGFVAGMKRVSKSIKEQYYKTPHWRRMAFLRKELDGFQCVQCKSRENLQTHHWRYNLFSENVQRDLITVCKPCHDILHMDISGSRVHFPRYVSSDLFEQINDTNDNSTHSDDSSQQSSCEGNDASGCSQCEGCSGGHEDADGTAGPITEAPESGRRTEIEG